MTYHLRLAIHETMKAINKLLKGKIWPIGKEPKVIK